MNSLTNDLSCPRCGQAVEVRQRGSAQGLHCPKCGWSVVTTRISEILLDTTTYELVVELIDIHQTVQLCAIGQLLGMNVVQTRKVLEAQGGRALCRGTAQEIAKAREELVAVGLIPKIAPTYPW